MKIEKINRIEDKFLTQNQICKELESNSSCIHNDFDKKLILVRKTQINEKFYALEMECLYCPFCGFTYKSDANAEIPLK